MRSITDSTVRQYNTGLQLWWTCCTHKNVNPYSVTVRLLLEFLTSQYNRGCSYGTLNSYRSAIAQISIEIANIVRSNEKPTIKIPNRLKTSAPKRCQQSLILPFYKEANICVARTLESYLEKSNNIRTASTDIFFIYNF